MEEVIQMISNVGFPIAVAIWMIVKDAQDKKEIYQVMSDLKVEVTKLADLAKVILERTGRDDDHYRK